MNLYDQAQLNPNDLLKSPLKTKSRKFPAISPLQIIDRKIALYSLIALYSTGLWRRLIRANLSG